MAGGSVLDRVLARAQKGPAQKRPAEETPPQQEPANTPEAVAVVGLENTHPPSKKKRAKGDEAKKGAVDAGGPSRVKPSTWFVSLSEAGQGDPLLACSEICRIASDRLRQAAAERKAMEGATGRVKELEKALKVANEKTISLEKELQLAREEFQSTKEELQSTKEELQSAKDELQLVTEDKEALEEETERLRSELDVVVEDATKILEESFENALRQVQLCHPELSIDRSIVHHLHTALGDRIEHRKSDGSVKLIFKDPAAP